MLDEDWLDRLQADIETVDSPDERLIVDEPGHGDDGDLEQDEELIMDEPDVGVIDDPDIVLTADYKQSKHTSYGRVGEGGRGARTPLESTMEAAAGILSKSFSLSQNQVRSILDEIESIKNIHLFNIETMILAVMWQNKKLPLTMENLNDFYKKNNKVDVELSDVFRYIRYLRLEKHT